MGQTVIQTHQIGGNPDEIAAGQIRQGGLGTGEGGGIDVGGGSGRHSRYAPATMGIGPALTAPVTMMRTLAAAIPGSPRHPMVSLSFRMGSWKSSC